MVGKYKGATPAQERVYRQARWRKLRALHLKVYNQCVVCGSREGLQVDHIRPYANNPALFYDHTNLQTLCTMHHSQKTALDRDIVRHISVDHNGYPIDHEHPWVIGNNKINKKNKIKK